MNDIEKGKEIAMRVFDMEIERKQKECEDFFVDHEKSMQKFEETIKKHERWKAMVLVEYPHLVDKGECKYCGEPVYYFGVGASDAHEEKPDKDGRLKEHRCPQMLLSNHTKAVKELEDYYSAQKEKGV